MSNDDPLFGAAPERRQRNTLRILCTVCRRSLGHKISTREAGHTIWTTTMEWADDNHWRYTLRGYGGAFEHRCLSPCAGPEGTDPAYLAMLDRRAKRSVHARDEAQKRRANYRAAVAQLSG